MRMSRETLRCHLGNEPLVQAIKAKRDVEQTRKELHAALDVLKRTGIGEAALAEVNAKLKEYSDVSMNYGNMIDETWHVIWQEVSVITRYLNCDYSELPEYARF